MLSGLAAIANERFNATDGDRPEQLPGRARVGRASSTCSASMPRSDARSQRRRTSPARQRRGRRPPLLDASLQRQPGVIGATLTLNGAPYTVVGALGIDLPPPFDDVDVWATRVDEFNGFPRTLIAGGLGYLTAVARLAPGVRVEQAQAKSTRSPRPTRAPTRPTPTPIPMPACGSRRSASGPSAAHDRRCWC